MSPIRLSENVVYRSFGEETVLLNLTTGEYHGLRGSGGRMLELLAETGDIARSAHRIAAELDHPVDAVRRDMEELCAGLAQRSLIVIEDPS